MRTETVKVACDHCGEDITGIPGTLIAREAGFAFERPQEVRHWDDPNRRDFCGTECLARWALKRLGWVNTIPPEHTPDPESMY